MSGKIISREKIELNEIQTKMIVNGWGQDVVNTTVVEKIVYNSDGLKVKGYIAYPINTEMKYPCVIWNRGGAGENGAIDKFNARGIFGQIASWGYTVFATQYRGNDGGEGKEHLGGDDVNDILNLIPLAEEIPQADNKLWGIEGWSRGGMMTYLTLLRNNNFKCAVLSGAISDLKQNAVSNPEMKKFYAEMIGAGNNSLDNELEKRSALYFVDKLPRIPYLLLHGGDDDTVSPDQTIEMAKRFHALHVPYRMIIWEGGDHFIKTHRKETDAMRKSWFDKYLKN